MEDSKRTLADVLSSLCLEPGFTLIPQDRYEELVRAEAERDLLECTLMSDSSYSAKEVMANICKARWKTATQVPQEPEGAE